MSIAEYQSLLTEFRHLTELWHLWIPVVSFEDLVCFFLMWLFLNQQNYIWINQYWQYLFTWSRFLTFCAAWLVRKESKSSSGWFWLGDPKTRPSSISLSSHATRIWIFRIWNSIRQVQYLVTQSINNATIRNASLVGLHQHLPLTWRLGCVLS